MTCEQAQVRFAGDYAYRRAVLAGTATAEREVFAGEGRASARKPGATVLVHMAEVPVLPTPTFDVEAVREAEPVARPVEERPAVVERPRQRPGRKPLEIVHGTRRGYLKGCRDREACRAALEGGESCQEAHNRYYRELKARKTGEPVASAKAARPKPGPVVIPAPTPVVIPEEAWDALGGEDSFEVNAQAIEEQRPVSVDALMVEDLGAEVLRLRSKNAGLKERVAFLELELDVAKAQIRDEQRRLVALVNELFREAS